MTHVAGGGATALAFGVGEGRAVKVAKAATASGCLSWCREAPVGVGFRVHGGVGGKHGRLIPSGGAWRTPQLPAGLCQTAPAGAPVAGRPPGAAA